MKYTISKNNYELEYYYQIRKKYIEQCQPNNKKELVYYINFSHILINIYFLGNKYSKTTQDNFKKTLLYHEKNKKKENSEKKREKKEKINKDTKKLKRSNSLHNLIENFIS
jgi:hypothetical protein